MSTKLAAKFKNSGRAKVPSEGRSFQELSVVVENSFTKQMDELAAFHDNQGYLGTIDMHVGARCGLRHDGAAYTAVMWFQ